MNQKQRISELETQIAGLTAANEQLTIKLKANIGRGNFMKAKLEGRIPRRIEIKRLENGHWGVLNASVLSAEYPDFASANSAAKQLSTSH